MVRIFDLQLAIIVLITYNMVRKVSIADTPYSKGGHDMQVNILEAKTNLSNLVRLIETGQEDSIVIARYGKPVVKMVVYKDVSAAKRIGAAKGKLPSPVDLDRDNAEIVALFGGTL